MLYDNKRWDKNIPVAHPVRDLLVAARAKVSDGWCQRGFQKGDSYCALGAMYAVSHDMVVLNKAVYALARALGFSDPNGVVRWNDAPGRTKAEIVAGFDRAIAAL